MLVIRNDEPTIPAYRARSFIFSDPQSKALIPLIQRVAPSDVTVLVIGETGTGKELVARHLHSLSGRSERPFIAVNCGAFSETLIEGELFGYEKGAFTGATVARPGWFEAAGDGTLFLDEIGDLPLALQVKLLRVLQEREVTRLGARTPIPLKARLIAATNVDLATAVSSGRFREDLYYRLQTVTLKVPPLRDRRADILPLARHFLDDYGARYGDPHLRLDVDAEDALFQYHWPGNIRELENVIQRASLLREGEVIKASDLALTMLPQAPTSSPVTGGITLDGAPPGLDSIRPVVRHLLSSGAPNLLADLVNTIVDEAYLYADNNQVRTAKALGVTRNTIRTRLKYAGHVRGDEELDD